MVRQAGADMVEMAEATHEEIVSPVARAFRMVRAIADAAKPLSLTEIADSAEIPASSAHRMLHLLARLQIVARAGERQNYAPGPELRRIAFAVNRNADLSARVREYVQKLAQELNTTVAYWNYDSGTRMLVAAEVQYSRHPIDFRESAFAPRPLLWGAQGRAVLAFLPDSEIAEQIALAGPSSPTGHRLEEPDAIRVELAEIRARGYARSQGHTIAEAIGFGAPVFAAGGRVAGCVGIPIPILRFREEDAPRLAQAVTETAGAISAEFGGGRLAPSSMRS